MKSLKQRLNDFEFPSYVHTYPTNRLYVPLPDFTVDQILFNRDTNVYFHIPFCDQKCSFCGYLTTVDRTGYFREHYVQTLIEEMELYAQQLSDKSFPTIHFGGGTPSLLSNLQIQRQGQNNNKQRPS